MFAQKRHALVMCILAAPLAGGCATGGGLKVDLEGARAAVAEAREADAPKRAPEALSRAEAHLQRAEALEAGRGVRRDRQGAQRAADLALAEAHCAIALSRALVRTEQVTIQAAAGTAEVDRLSARLRRMEDDQKRLEERLAVLARDLEVTETELIRTKARLKGNETKAEASAAIAEARILAGRLAEEAALAPVAARSEESLSKAEEQLGAGNFGAALFFASKAQDIVARAREGGRASGPSERIPSLTTYRARTVARIRRGPSLDDEIAGRLPTGAEVTGEAVSGEWVKVTYRGLSGWVHGSLLE